MPGIDTDRIRYFVQSVGCLTACKKYGTMYALQENYVMGRAPLKLDENLLLDMITTGMSDADMAKVMGVSAPTIRNHINRLKDEESELLAYDKVRNLDLISVQRRLVEGITDEKIAEAPLSSIATAFSAFHKAEQLNNGRPTEIHGLVGYLMHLESEDLASKQEVGESVDAEFDTGNVQSGQPEQLELF
jgi:predicted transcriptional regulator